LVGGHLQTFLLEFANILINICNNFFKYYKFAYRREIFHLSDGGEIAIDHCVPTTSPKNNIVNKILLVIPGYTSNSEDYYLKSFAENFIEDFDVKIMNFRGFGGLKLKTPKMVCIDSFKDVNEYLKKLSIENINNKIYCVGFSFGGMMLARIFGKDANILPGNIVAGAGICYPYHLGQTAKYCEKNAGGIYSKFSFKNIKQCFFENIDTIFNEKHTSKRMLDNKENIINVMKNECLCSDFDRIFSVNEMDLIDLEDYYEQSRLDSYVPNIKKPFLSIFTRDDPIVPFDLLPFKQMENNKNLVTVVNNSGGHLGFFSGMIPERWISQPVKTFIKSVDYLAENRLNEMDDI